MISENLADKQAEMQARSQEKRAKQNGKNSSGKRVIRIHSEKIRSTRRPIADIIRDIISRPETSARTAAYLIFQACCLQKKEKPPSWQEFFNNDRDDSDANRFAEAARQQPLPDIPAPQAAPEGPPLRWNNAEADEAPESVPFLQPEVFSHRTS